MLIPVLIAIGIGGVAYEAYQYWTRPKGKPGKVTPGGNPTVVPTTEPLTPLNPVTGKPVAPGSPTFAQQVSKSGQAVPQAHALFDYLKAKKYDHTAKYVSLVKAFQTATNADPYAKALHGPIPATGQYDLDTSAALTLYTGDPIPADPSTTPLAPPTGQQVLNTPGYIGSAAKTGFNLQQYLKAHGNDKSATLSALVKPFQHDVNTDPQFPGPASVAVKIITTPLTEDGKYGPATAKALAVFGGV